MTHQPGSTHASPWFCDTLLSFLNFGDSKREKSINQSSTRPLRASTNSNYVIALLSRELPICWPHRCAKFQITSLLNIEDQNQLYELLNQEDGAGKQKAYFPAINHAMHFGVSRSNREAEFIIFPLLKRDIKKDIELLRKWH